jgi:Skp family chaperone for outer membrane proteins
MIVGLAALAAPFGQPARAQQPGATAGATMPAQTKYATVNIGQVMKNYKKVTYMTEEMKKLAEPFEKSGKQWVDYYKQLKDIVDDPKKNPDDREKAQKAMVDAKRHLEDINLDMDKALHGKQDQMLVQVYREIYDAVKAYAQQNGIQVVLQYSDAIDPTEFFMAGNIQRKLKGSMAGAYVPLYIADGVDITAAVVTMLNNNLPGPSPAPAATGGKQQ